MIVQGEPDVSGSIIPFLERVGETAAWCRWRVDVTRPATCLRDPRTQPRRLEPDYFAAVRTVASSRPKGADADAPVPRPAWDREGRLMVYYPDADLCDGAAEIMTDGWFDVFNCPPWDTWVGFFRDRRPAGDFYANYLVAWVPGPFVELAARGIDANPEQCIAWLDDTECGIRALLRGTPPSAGGFLSRLFGR